MFDKDVLPYPVSSKKYWKSGFQGILFWKAAKLKVCIWYLFYKHISDQSPDFILIYCFRNKINFTGTYKIVYYRPLE